MTQVLEQELGLAGRESRTAAISGPNIASEIGRGLPATTVVAGERAADRDRVQSALTSSSFRVYTNSDVIGVELGGALKNVIAIALGHGGESGRGRKRARGAADARTVGDGAVGRCARGFAVDVLRIGRTGRLVGYGEQLELTQPHAG